MKLVANSIAMAALLICTTLLTSCGGKKSVDQADFIDSVQCVQTTVTYSVAESTVKTNEYLDLVVTAATNDTSTIIFPDTIRLEGFIPVDRTVSQGRVVEHKTIEYSCRYVFEPTVPGDFTIHPFNVKTVQGETAHSVATLEIPVTVRSLFAEGAPVDIMDIEPPASELNHTLLCSLLAIMLIVLLATVYRINHGDQGLYRCPLKQAEYEISQLNSSDREFAHRLREICITYLERQTEVNFGAASNEEVIFKLEELRIFNVDIIGLFSELLGGINRAKYSQEAIAAQDLCSQALEFLARSTVSFEVSKEFAEGEVS